MNSHIQLDNEGNFLRLIPAGLPIEWDENNYCTAYALEADGKALEFRVFPYYSSAKPEYDAITQGIRGISPKLINGLWTEAWEVYDLSPEEVLANQQKQAEEASLRVLTTIQQLEREQLMPRITREAILRIAEKEAEEMAASLGVDPALILAKNKAYTLLKAFDNQIAELRAQL
jgi:hypothetical protein